MGRVNIQKTLSGLFEIVMIVFIFAMIIFFFSMANELAEGGEEPPGPIPEHVYERLLDGDGSWE